MTMTINATDKFLAGVHHSFTITSDEGLPGGEVLVGETAIPHQVIHLQDPKYKISFLIPEDAVGQQLTVRLQGRQSTVEETREIAAE